MQRPRAGPRPRATLPTSYKPGHLRHDRVSSSVQRRPLRTGSLSGYWSRGSFFARRDMPARRRHSPSAQHRMLQRHSPPPTTAMGDYHERADLPQRPLCRDVPIRLRSDNRPLHNGPTPRRSAPATLPVNVPICSRSYDRLRPDSWRRDIYYD